MSVGCGVRRRERSLLGREGAAAAQEGKDLREGSPRLPRGGSGVPGGRFGSRLSRRSGGAYQSRLRTPGVPEAVVPGVQGMHPRARVEGDEADFSRLFILSSPSTWTMASVQSMTLALLGMKQLASSGKS